MKLCVIGAGAAGLCAAKQGIDFGCEVTVYEKSSEVGGTWVYTDDVGVDKNGLEIHSSMYKGLYTNLPKEIMGYPSVPFTEQDLSYIPAQDVLKYYQTYVKQFNLRHYINFEHNVLRVRPLSGDNSWEVIVQDLNTKSYETLIFDVILVCNGHYAVPNLIKWPGHDLFRGQQIHSHNYRVADKFRDETVLVIGAGPSGTDITLEISKVAKNVTWSHHLTCSPVTPGINQKPDVKEITANGVVFVDGTYQDFTVIIYCTGYKYSFPFLSVDCGLEVGEHFVRPLYKHCLNITRPTMGLIGIPNYICPNQMCDLQVRFCLTFMTGRKNFPSKQEMLDDLKRDTDEREARGVLANKAHYMGNGVQDVYYAELAAAADVEPIKPVISKIFAKGICNLLHNSEGFRNETFKIIDDENFIVSTQSSP